MHTVQGSGQDGRLQGLLRSMKEGIYKDGRARPKTFKSQIKLRVRPK